MKTVNYIKNIAGALLLTMAFTACNPINSDHEKQVITVSVLPYQYFVEKIAADLYEIEVMIPPGASPATYEPTPRQVLNLSKSKCYLMSGYLAFEQNWISNLKAELPNLKFFDTSRGLNLMENNHEHDHEHAADHEHGLIEPHVWTSPKNVKKIAQNIATALKTFDPEKESLFEKNLQIFIREIDELDHECQQKLSNIENRSFIIYHPALSYYARDYNLSQFPIEQNGKEPTVKYIQEISALAKEHEIRVILIQKQFNMHEAKTLEKEIDGKIIEIDPLDLAWSDQIRFITKSLSENL